MPIACTRSLASLAMKVSCSPKRAAAVFSSSAAARRKTPTTAARRDPRAPRGRERGSESASAASAAAVHATGWPGRTVQPSTSRSSVAGGIRLRRRLSRIFQRAMSGRRLRVRPGARRHERKQPPQDLPVAAHPAVLPPRVREDARRVVVHDLDVGDERRARVEPLEQIVRQQRVLRHAALERRRERVDVVEPLAGEDALVEEILVDVGDGGRVRDRRRCGRRRCARRASPPRWPSSR